MLKFIEDRINGENRFSQIRGSYLGNGELDAEVLSEVGDLINNGAMGFILAWHPVNDSSEEAINYARIIQIPQPRIMRTLVIEGVDGVPVTVSPNLSEKLRYVILGDLSFYDVDFYHEARNAVEHTCVESGTPRAYFIDGGEMVDYFTLNYGGFDENSPLYPTVPTIWLIGDDGRHICRTFTQQFYPATIDDVENLDEQDQAE